MKARTNRAPQQRGRRPLRMEALEDRTLLSVSVDGQIDSSAAVLDWGGTVIGDDTSRLLKIDPGGGSPGLQPKFLGYMGVTMTDLAFARDGTLYGVTAPSPSSTTSWLYRINVSDYTKEFPYASVSSTPLFPIWTGVSTGAVSLNSLEFDVNTLWAAGLDRDQGDNALFTIDITTGKATRYISLSVPTGPLAGNYHSAGDLDFDAPFGHAYVTTTEGPLLVLHRDVTAPATPYLEPRAPQPSLTDLQGLIYGRFGTSSFFLALPEHNKQFTQTKEVVRLDPNTGNWVSYGTMTLNNDLLGAATLQVNQPPVGVDDPYSVDKNGVLDVAAPGVLSNDSDPEHDPITAVNNTAPQHAKPGTFTFNSSGKFHYEPATGYYGQDSFTYQVFDGYGYSGATKVTITVVGSAPPVARDDEYLVSQNTVLQVPPQQGLLINDTCFVLGKPFTAVLQTLPSDANQFNRSLGVGFDGSFTYEPAAGFYGVDSFTYKAYDTLNYSDQTATVRIRVFRPLGTVGYAEQNGQNPATGNGELWYQFQTVRPGYATIEALTGSASMVLYNVQDGSLHELAVSSSLGTRQRINWSAGAAGEVYYVKLTGADTNIALHVANLVTKSGPALTVYGTDGADLFQLDSASLAVTIKNVGYDATDYGSPAVTAITFNGGLGNNTAQIAGSSADETLTAYPSSATFSRTGLSVSINNVTTTSVQGGGGSDVAYLCDSPGTDTFTAGYLAAELTDGVYHEQVAGFSSVNAYSTAGGTDSAILTGSPGDDTFSSSASPLLASLAGAGYSNRAKYFRYVYAYGAAGTTDGHDVAYLKGSSDNDAFLAYPTWAWLTGPTFFDRVKYFDEVYADGGVGIDTATLYDSAGNDEFHGNAPKIGSWMSGPGFLNSVKNIERVYARAMAGGNDKAFHNDTSGDDVLNRGESWTRLTSAALKFFTDTFGFQQTTATSTTGTDKAYVTPVPAWLLLVGPWGLFPK